MPPAVVNTGDTACLIMSEHSSSPRKSDDKDPLWGAVEILPQRLYYAPLKSTEAPSPTSFFGKSGGSGGPLKNARREISYFSIDNELIYWNFFLDFGPLNLGQLYRFCSKLNDKLSSRDLSQKIICFYSGAQPQRRANAVFLICAWQILYLNRSLDEAYYGFLGNASETIPTPPPSSNTSMPPSNKSPRASSSPSPYGRLHPLPPFHDASPVACTYDLSVYDCLSGLVRAQSLGFFDFDDFDVDEYDYFEQVENGDLNWIVKGKILAFAGPQAMKKTTPEGYCMLTPGDYTPYFQKKKVGLVVRLNKKCYDENDFADAGIRHVNHVYPDGSCPNMRTLRSIVRDMESIPQGEAFAVHCKAGLGRTGTCIGAYLMKHFRFTAAEVIGWMRICRPGCVIGPQQHFLRDIERVMWRDGEERESDPAARPVLPPRDRGREGEGDHTAAGTDAAPATPEKRTSRVSVVTPGSARSPRESSSRRPCSSGLPIETLNVNLKEEIELERGDDETERTDGASSSSSSSAADRLSDTQADGLLSRRTTRSQKGNSRC